MMDRDTVSERVYSLIEDAGIEDIVLEGKSRNIVFRDGAGHSHCIRIISDTCSDMNINKMIDTNIMLKGLWYRVYWILLAPISEEDHYPTLIYNRVGKFDSILRDYQYLNAKPDFSIVLYADWGLKISVVNDESDVDMVVASILSGEILDTLEASVRLVRDMYSEKSCRIYDEYVRWREENHIPETGDSDTDWFGVCK